jgi:hypothetical protein
MENRLLTAQHFYKYGEATLGAVLIAASLAMIIKKLVATQRHPTATEFLAGIGPIR